MNVQVKSSTGLSLIPLETRLMASRKIFIEGEINAESACLFAKQVMQLNAEDSKLPIRVMINSPGGEINSGLLMYDIIQKSKAPIITFCMGRAFSMAAVIFASGRHGRYMFPHSELMLHEPLLGSQIQGNSSSIKSISDSLLKTKKKLNRLLSIHTGKSEAEIESVIGYDHYFNAQESCDFGLCDRIISFDEIEEV